MNGNKHSAADFERFYQERLGLALSWVTRWDKPFFLAADVLERSTEDGKRMPSPGASLWYYLIALTQPKCIGLAWCFYGSTPLSSENLNGLMPGKHPDITQVHREIGAAILGKPSLLGLPGEIGPPPPQLR